MKFEWDSLVDWMKHHSIGAFRTRVLPMPWYPRSVLLSEAFAFCAMMDLYDVDAVLESGVGNGRSTEIWAKYLAHPRIILAIDKQFDYRVSHRLNTRGVQLVQGESHDVLINRLSDLTQHRVAVFIDGPKDHEALDLARECHKHAQTMFVGIHDMARLINGRPHAAREAMEAAGAVWFTDAEWFVEAYHELDANESHWDLEQGTRWTPYHRSERNSKPIPLGSYGYTIGFLVPEHTR